MNLANDLEKKVREPETQAGWAELMQELGVQGIHIAEKDSQTSITKKSASEFINTWSVEGMIAESIQPAELGWGTHEEQLPKNAHTHVGGSKCAIYLDTPGGQTKLRSWVPSGPQEAYLITHNEAISISEYFTVRDSEGSVVYRPTCNYAYHPTADTIQSLAEMFDKPTAHIEHTILAAENIATGSDELGVLLYGHKKNAYWYGSKLTIEETRKLAPHQNATGLQVTSAVLSGIVWMITYPTKGIVEVEEIDYKMCLNLQRKYLGSVSGVYTDWYPNNTMKESLPEEKRWQFSNIKM